VPAFGDRDSILPLPGLLLVPLLLSVPRDQREGEDGVIVLLGLGLAAGLGLIALLAHRQQGRDRLVGTAGACTSAPGAATASWRRRTFWGSAG
jgi:hypothetical protein